MRIHLFAVAVLAASSVGSAPASERAHESGWIDAVRRGIADREYHVTWQDRTLLPDLDAAWQAPNRAQGLRTYFAESGIRVVPRRTNPGERPASVESGFGLFYGR